MFREGKIDKDTVDCPRFVAFKGASREDSSSSFNLGQLTKRIHGESDEFDEEEARQGQRKDRRRRAPFYLESPIGFTFTWNRPLCAVLMLLGGGGGGGVWSQIKLITFGNELRTYDMIPKFFVIWNESIMHTWTISLQLFAPKSKTPNSKRHWKLKLWSIHHWCDQRIDINYFQSCDETSFKSYSGCVCWWKWCACRHRRERKNGGKSKGENAICIHESNWMMVWMYLAWMRRERERKREREREKERERCIYKIVRPGEGFYDTSQKNGLGARIERVSQCNS